MPDRLQTLPSSLAAAIRKKAPGSIEFAGESACTTIASYNVHKCVGSDGRFDPARVARVVAEIDADIIALQEADERTGARMGLLDLDALQRNTDLVPTHTPENNGSHGWHGNLILARRGIIQDVRQVKLPGFEPRGAIIVDLELKGVALRVVAAHFGLVAALALAAGSGAGGSHPIRGQADDPARRPQRMAGAQPLVTAGALPHFGPIHAVLPSFPSRYPLLALDRIMARPANLITRIEVHQTPLARLASDHLPIKARLNLGIAQETTTQPDFA